MVENSKTATAMPSSLADHCPLLSSSGGLYFLSPVEADMPCFHYGLEGSHQTWWPSLPLLHRLPLQTLNITSQHYLAYAWLQSTVCIWGADILWECFQTLISRSSLNYPVVRHWSGSDKIIARLLWSSYSQWTFWSLLAASCLAIWDNVWKRSKTLKHSKWGSNSPYSQGTAVLVAWQFTEMRY